MITPTEMNASDKESLIKFRGCFLWFIQHLVCLITMHIIHNKLVFFSTDETIKWFDGTPTDQSNWGIRKPEVDHFKPHLCVALRIPEGVWQLSSCQDKKGFICKMEAGG